MHDVQPLGFMLLETQIEEKNPIYIFYIYILNTCIRDLPQQWHRCTALNPEHCMTR